MNSNRQQNIEKLKTDTYDVLIIGGGINGAVAAASLSARGLKIALIDKEDFASGSSSQSSCLVWGGIKYLESHEYLLVNNLCQGRNNLIRHYPSTVKEIRFLTTIQKGFRFPVWLVFLGTIFYWIIGRFFTQPPKYLLTRQVKSREPCINTDNAQGGFEYSDAYLEDNDARFVFNHISRAMKNDAVVANYVESKGSTRVDNNHWVTDVYDSEGQQNFQIKADILINTCGPWVDEQNRLSQQNTSHHHLLSKGVHLIVDKIPQAHRVLAFFASDGRLFFMIPMGHKTCIGTTDTQVTETRPGVTQEDREFILENANKLLDLPEPLKEEDIISERCGVRPLAIEAEDGVADWVQLSRKHAVDIDKAKQHISVFGGKLTDCVNVGEEIAEAVEDLGKTLKPLDELWYGEPPVYRREQFFKQAKQQGLDKLTPKDSLEPLSERFWRRYGEDAFQLLRWISEDHTKAEQAIEHTPFTWAEIDWIAENEMVVELGDLLRRRSKLGLLIRKEQLSNAKGLEKVCEILFGGNAEEKLAHFQQTL